MCTGFGEVNYLPVPLTKVEDISSAEALVANKRRKFEQNMAEVMIRKFFFITRLLDTTLPVYDTPISGPLRHPHHLCEGSLYRRWLVHKPPQ